MLRPPIKKHQRGVSLFVLQWLTLQALRYVRDLSSKGFTKVHSDLDALLGAHEFIVELPFHETCRMKEPMNQRISPHRTRFAHPPMTEIPEKSLNDHPTVPPAK